MKYDFTTLIDRTSTYSMKWNIPKNAIPLWVADMDFATAPCITEALEKRVSHGIFGYTEVPDAWYEAYISWWRDYHGYTIARESLVFCTGVIPAMSSIVRKMANRGDNVLMLTPIYNTFYNSIINNGCNPLEVELMKDLDSHGQITYDIDWQSLEDAMALDNTRLMIFCNPHNPLLKIWTRDEIDRLGSLAAKHGVLVVSDEVHCDLVDPGYEYIPYASVSECNAMNSITCIAPSKTFNCAGLQSAAVMIPNSDIRKLVDRGLNTDEVAEPNAFAMDATIAAFTQGRDWADELREVIADNKSFSKKYLEDRLADIKVMSGPATYLMWLDVSACMENEGFERLLSRLANQEDSAREFQGIDADRDEFCDDYYSQYGGWYTGAKSRSEILADYLTEEFGVMLSFGSLYGHGGENFLRLNVACPRARLEEGLDRLCKGLESLG